MAKKKAGSRPVPPDGAGASHTPKEPAVEKKAATKKASVKKPAAKKAATPRATARPAKRASDAPPVEKTRVVVPTEIYEERKDEFKAPFKEHELKWNYLGTGRGLYKRADGGVHCFTQFKDDGVHYSVWGDDRAAVDAILATWRGLLGAAAWATATATGESAAAGEAAQKDSEAMRLWRMQEPQRRPGEPDLFFEKRFAEWRAKQPAAND